MDEIILSLVEAVARLNERLNEQQDVVRVPGEKGRPPTEAEIKAAVDKWMANNAEAINGKDGDSVTAKMVEAVAVEWLAKNIVQPKDGDSAKDPTAAQIQTAVDLWAEFNRDSLLPTDEQVANAAEAWLAKNIKQPKNGADAKPVTKEQIEAVAHEWLNANRASLKGDTTKPDEPVGIALIEQRDEKSFWITLDDGREYQIDLPEPAKFFGGGGGGLSKARADELYAPIGSGGDSIALVAAEQILAYKLVTTDSAGQVIYGDAGTLAHWNTIIGLSLNAASIGDLVTIEDSGLVSNSGWSWTPQEALFVGLNGDITNAQVGAFSQAIGYAVSPTQIFLRLGRAVVRAD